MSNRAIGYVRVSTQDQALNGVSLDAQRTALERACAARGWVLERIESDQASAATVRKRAGLARAMAAAKEGGLPLVVARLDRLSRSVGDFCGLMDQADREGWSIVCLDPAVDMASPFGKAMVQVAATMAELERSLISMRTKEGIAAAKANGTYTGGGKTTVAQDTSDLIVRLRDDGWTYGLIAHYLDDHGIPAPGGGGYKWHRQTVARIYARAQNSTSVDGERVA